MQRNKVPDPDGLNLTFYHNFGDHCAKNVFEACKMLLDNEALSPNFNDTNIVLLPIGRDSKHHQRSETCTNVVYKILDKVMAI
jgi:hypothetical protein